MAEKGSKEPLDVRFRRFRDEAAAYITGRSSKNPFEGRKIPDAPRLKPPPKREETVTERYRREDEERRKKKLAAKDMLRDE